MLSEISRILTFIMTNSRPRLCTVFNGIPGSAKFSNGTLKPEKGKEVTFGSFEERAPTNKKKRKRMLVAETCGQTYVGQNFGVFTPAAAEHCRYMVGIVDKKTGKMSVHDAEILNMKPYRGDEAQDEEKEERSFMEKSDMLTEAFGSTKKKRAMNTRHKNKLTTDNLKDAVDTAVDKTLIRADVDEVLKIEGEKKALDNLPPHNLEATRAADAYPLSGIISDVEMEALQSCASVFVSCDKKTIAEWEQESKYPKIVLRHLRVLPLQEKARLHKSCRLMYLHYMIQLFKLKSSDFKKKDLFTSMKMPSLVEKSLLKRFTLQIEGTKIRTMPARLKDKLICYILVLCLILDEFRMDFMILLEDMKLGKQKVTNFLRTLGCKCDFGGKKKTAEEDAVLTAVATLHVPLKFPEPRMKKAAKQKNK